MSGSLAKRKSSSDGREGLTGWLCQLPMICNPFERTYLMAENHQICSLKGITNHWQLA